MYVLIKQYAITRNSMQSTEQTNVTPSLYEEEVFLADLRIWLELRKYL